jgi:microcystin-dependent protein
MADNFIGEIRIVSFNFAPTGWTMCNGQLLPINQNQALFSLLGTTYGGDGQVTFALPDLRGRSPMHFGTGPGRSPRSLGERSGEENHTLLSSEMPAHTHTVNVVNRPGTQTSPAGNFLAARRGGFAESGNVPMHSGAVANFGNSQGHLNLAPFLAITFCIALQGIFPSQG